MWQSKSSSKSSSQEVWRQTKFRKLMWKWYEAVEKKKGNNQTIKIANGLWSESLKEDDVWQRKIENYARSSKRNWKRCAGRRRITLSWCHWTSWNRTNTYDEIGIKFQKTSYKNKQRPKKKNAKLNFNENQFQMFEEQFKIKLLSKK